MLSLESYPQPAAGVVGRVVNAEAVIVLASKGEVKVLNEVGSLIWSLSDGTRSVGEIAAQVNASFQVALDQAQADTLEFVGQLVERGALTLVDLQGLPGA
jgi:hypothetical protein